MKIKINQEIKQTDGIKSIANPENGKPMTLKDVCINALLALVPNQKDDENAKYLDYELFLKLRDVEEIDLKAEEIVRIKKKIGLAYPPLVLGQAWDFLEDKIK